MAKSLSGRSGVRSVDGCLPSHMDILAKETEFFVVAKILQKSGTNTSPQRSRCGTLETKESEMGEIAEAMINGDMDCITGEWIGGGYGCPMSFNQRQTRFDGLTKNQIRNKKTNERRKRSKAKERLLAKVTP